jgi:hypothetical protein
MTVLPCVDFPRQTGPRRYVNVISNHAVVIHDRACIDDNVIAKYAPCCQCKVTTAM